MSIRQPNQNNKQQEFKQQGLAQLSLLQVRKLLTAENNARENF